MSVLPSGTRQTRCPNVNSCVPGHEGHDVPFKNSGLFTNNTTFLLRYANRQHIDICIANKYIPVKLASWSRDPLKITLTLPTLQEKRKDIVTTTAAENKDYCEAGCANSGWQALPAGLHLRRPLATMVQVMNLTWRLAVTVMLQPYSRDMPSRRSSTRLRRCVARELRGLMAQAAKARDV